MGRVGVRLKQETEAGAEPGTAVMANRQVRGGHGHNQGPWLPGCALSKPDSLAWLCVSCLVTSCRRLRTGTRFLLLFSLFQAFSIFPECILLGSSDPGVRGPQACWTGDGDYTPLSFPQHQGPQSLGRGAAILRSPSVPGCFQDCSYLRRLCIPDCLLGTPLTKLP